MQTQSTLLKIPVYSYKGKSDILVQVGYTIEGEDVYYSRRKPEHFFKIFHGYGMSIDVYNEMVRRQVKTIILYYEDKMYESQLSQWKHSSRWDNEILATEKIDPQYILEIQNMKIYNYQEKGGVKMMEQKELDDLENVGPVASSGVDLQKYDKEITIIEKCEIMQLTSQYTEVIPNSQPPVHYMQWILKVSSVPLESIREGIDKIDFRASELFNLTQDSKGKLIGFPTGEGAKLMKFMKDLKIQNPEQFKTLKEVIAAIKGKKAVIKAVSKIKDGRTNTYLSFRY